MHPPPPAGTCPAQAFLVYLSLCAQGGPTPPPLQDMAAAGAGEVRPPAVTTTLAPLPSVDLVVEACVMRGAGGAASGSSAAHANGHGSSGGMSLPTPPLLLDAGTAVLLLPAPTHAPRPLPHAPGAAAAGEGAAEGVAQGSGTGGTGSTGGTAVTQGLQAALSLISGRFNVPDFLVVSQAVGEEGGPAGGQGSGAPPGPPSPSTSGSEGGSGAQDGWASSKAGVESGAVVAVRELLELLEPAFQDTWPEQASQLAGMQAAASSGNAQVAASSLAALLVGGQQGCGQVAQRVAEAYVGQAGQSLLQWARQMGVYLLPPA